MVIYSATNQLDGKVYVGQTTGSLKNRRYFHEYDSMKGSTLLFHRALRKYGFESFDWQVIDQAETEQELNDKEKYWIQFYKSFDPQFGYNLTMGGQNGSCPNEETKRKMSSALKGRIFTIEWKNKISDSMRGRTIPENVRKKISNSLSGQNHPMYGKRGKDSPLYGRKYSAERCKNIALGQKGRHLSEETKRKISESKKRRRENVIISEVSAQGL